MNRERMLQVLLSPHVSEKAALAADKAGQHVFRVATDADKREIRKAVETLFDVKVRSVRVINAKGKRKLFGRSPGRRSDWKKAYVTLAEGQEIDLLGGAEP